jgi:N,N-dimethylformamidase beta subunit-like, C-terminal
MFPSNLKHAFMLALAVLAPFCADAAPRRRAADHPGLSLAEVSSQGGYASRASVFQGGTLTFHIASTVQPLTVEILNLADPDHVLMTIENLASAAQNCAGQSANGCGWEATTTISIPFSWPSGYYAARFPTSLGQRWAPFIVRAVQAGNRSKMLVLSSTHTWQAFNRFGGPGPSDRVSYQRPYRQHDGLGGYSDDEQLFVDWLAAQDLPFEAASDADLEDSTLLSRYTLVVIPGRAEYWTARARENIEQFSSNGGHIAVLNGSTMGRQVLLEDDNQTLVGTSQAGTADPEHPQLVTANWFEHPLYNPETRFFGTSLLYGGYANRVSADDHTLLPLEQRTGWTVASPSHWIFAGTNLVLGSTFGRETVGPEVGGTLFNCDIGGRMIGVDASSGTPVNFHVLAWTPASEGTGTLGIYTTSGGGAVFNAASQRWVYGLSGNPVVSRITRNVIDQLITGQRLPNDDKTAMLLTEETFNCQQYTQRVLAGWTPTLPAQPAITARCSYEGPTGLELSGTEGIEVVRDFTPGQPLAVMGARFYVNLDSYEGKPDAPLARVTLRNTVEGQADVPLVVEFDTVNSKAQTRLVRRDSAGNLFAGEWLELGPGWHMIWVTWRALGDIVLQLEKLGPTRVLHNPDGKQFVGEIGFEYPAVNRDDNSGFVCFDALAVGHVKPGSLPPTK